jgi:hypothetical protein
MAKMGPKPMIFTEQQRKLVEKMSGFGVPFANIAALVTDDGIDEDTLNRYFKKELAQGKSKTNSQVGKKLFQRCMDGDTSALIWWSKTQMRWKEDKSEPVSLTEDTITQITRSIVGAKDKA